MPRPLTRTPAPHSSRKTLLTLIISPPKASATCPGMCLNGNMATGVEHRVSTNVIFWGSYWNTNPYIVPAMLQLFAGMHGTQWQGIMGQYNVYGEPAFANYAIDTTNRLPSDIKETNLYNEVTYWAGQWGLSGTLDNQFLVFSPPGQKSGFLQYGTLCGAHTSQNGYVFSLTAYNPCGSITNSTEALTVIASHEYAESATDPYCTGWYGNGGCQTDEIGDGACDLLVGPTIQGVSVQELYDNATQNCVGGSTQGTLPSRIVGAAADIGAGTGYWTVGSDGSVFYDDGAPYLGSKNGQPLNAPIVGIAPTQGNGYWLAASDGGIFNFGNAVYHNSLPGEGIHPNAPIVGIVATTDAGGYWLIGQDGGIFNFGDAGYYGSLPGSGIHPNAPIVGMWKTLDNHGYYIVGADGGVFNYGDATYYGSLPGSGITPNKPVSGISAVDPYGYWIVAQDGGIWNYGDEPYEGSAGSYPAQVPVVGFIQSLNLQFYAFVAADQTAYTYSGFDQFGNLPN